MLTYLAEETSGSSTRRRVVIDVNVVVLSRDRLLNKGLGHDLVSNLDCVLINDLEFWRGTISFHTNPTQFELLDN